MADDRKKAEGYRYVATISDYQECFGTESGKKVLNHLMKVHGLLDVSFVEGRPDATAFNEGGRNAVLQIVKKLRVDIRKLEKMIIEEAKLREEDDVNE